MAPDRPGWWEPDLTTARLTGRAPTDSDAALLARVFGDATAARFLSLDGGAWSNSEISKTARRLAAHWGAHGFGPYLWFENGLFAGYAGLKFKLIEGGAAIELMYGAPPAMQGRGLMTEAAAAALEAGRALGYAQISVVALPENGPSVAVARRLGFVETAPVAHEGRSLVRLLYRYK